MTVDPAMAAASSKRLLIDMVISPRIGVKRGPVRHCRGPSPKRILAVQGESFDLDQYIRVFRFADIHSATSIDD
jgi:hypothetical protein